MSKRGRPATSTKKPVTMRIEVELWNALDKAKQMGLIRSREQLINDMLRERVEALRPLMEEMAG